MITFRETSRNVSILGGLAFAFVIFFGYFGYQTLRNGHTLGSSFFQLFGLFSMFSIGLFAWAYWLHKKELKFRSRSEIRKVAIESCKVCGANLPVGSAFCPQCGTHYKV